MIDLLHTGAALVVALSALWVVRDCVLRVHNDKESARFARDETLGLVRGVSDDLAGLGDVVAALGERLERAEQQLAAVDTKRIEAQHVNLANEVARAVRELEGRLEHVETKVAVVAEGQARHNHGRLPGAVRRPLPVADPNTPIAGR